MAKKYTLVVLTNPVAGREDEFNSWYSKQHLKDVISIPGFVSAQRFKIVGQPVAADPLFRYYATYDLETDDPEGALAEMMRRVGTDKMPMSDGMDSKFFVVLYEAITPVISSS
jgi:hypothetical protein